jgi:hypothetical protein
MNKLPGKSPISTIVATLFLFAAVTAFIARGQIEKNTSHRAPVTSTPTPSKTFIRLTKGLEEFVIPVPTPTPTGSERHSPDAGVDVYPHPGPSAVEHKHPVAKHFGHSNAAAAAAVACAYADTRRKANSMQVADMGRRRAADVLRCDMHLFARPTPGYYSEPRFVTDGGGTHWLVCCLSGYLPKTVNGEVVCELDHP